mmetsp:Transcript_31938/g.67966  ORF Transcript_31938/g.67966 Transcript_31938/m.67966 type:complete len:116 (-) Transcript_31938:87-434(-)
MVRVALAVLLALLRCNAHAVATHAPAVAVPRLSDGMPGLLEGSAFDRELLSRADQEVARTVDGESAGVALGASRFRHRPRAALAVRAQESQSTRAARYFAVHGMQKVARWLGVKA